MGWWPCGGCGAAACAHCTSGTTPDQVSIAISGFTSPFGCTNCGTIDRTIVATRSTSPSYPCSWSTSIFSINHGPGLACGYIGYHLILDIKTVPLSSNIGWVLELWGGIYLHILETWSWNSGGTSAFDCSIARTLTHNTTVTYPCSTSSNATITPL